MFHKHHLLASLGGVAFAVFTMALVVPNASATPILCEWLDDGQSLNSNWSDPLFWSCGHVPNDIANDSASLDQCSLDIYQYVPIELVNLTITDTCGIVPFDGLTLSGTLDNRGRIIYNGSAPISLANGNDTDSGTWEFGAEQISLPFNDFYNLNLYLSSSTFNGTIAPGDLTINGDLLVDGSGPPEHAAQITVQGNIIARGDYSDSYGFLVPAEGSSLIFNGSTQQSIMGNEYRYDSVVFDNPAGFVPIDGSFTVHATNITMQTGTAFPGPAVFDSTNPVEAVGISLTETNCTNNNCTCIDCTDGGYNTGWSFIAGECNDGLDNDYDGDVDYPADADCANVSDHESPDLPTFDCTWTGGGALDNFQDAANWDCGRVPGPFDSVDTSMAAKVYLTADVSVDFLYNQSTLQLRGFNLTANKFLNVGSLSFRGNESITANYIGGFAAYWFCGVAGGGSQEYELPVLNFGYDFVINTTGADCLMFYDNQKDATDIAVTRSDAPSTMAQMEVTGLFKLGNDLFVQYIFGYGTTVDQQGHHVTITNGFLDGTEDITFTGDVTINEGFSGTNQTGTLTVAGSLDFTGSDKSVVGGDEYVPNAVLNFNSQTTTVFSGITFTNVHAVTPLTCYNCTDGGGNTNITFLTADCSDGLDNDADNLTDYPNDPECASAVDTTETGDTCTWTGNGDGATFQDSDNWDCNHVPGIGDTALRPSGQYPTIRLTNDVHISVLGTQSEPVSLALDGYDLIVDGTMYADQMYIRGDENVTFDEQNSILNSILFCGDPASGAQELQLFNVPQTESLVPGIALFPSDCPSLDTSDVLVTPSSGIRVLGLSAESTNYTLKLGGDLVVYSGPFAFGKITINQNGHTITFEGGYSLFISIDPSSNFIFTGNLIFPPTVGFDQYLQPEDDDVTDYFTVQGTLTVPMGMQINPYGQTNNRHLIFDSQTTTHFTGVEFWHTTAVTPLVCKNCTNGGGNANIGFVGDSSIDGAENCDDGNTTSGDGCSEWGEIESGYACAGEPSVCTTGCGNGVVFGSEACDDGNVVNTDACTNICTFAVCGDGFVQAGEQCDDGDTADNDGCSAICRVESGFSCTQAQPTVCNAITDSGVGGGGGGGSGDRGSPNGDRQDGPRDGNQPGDTSTNGTTSDAPSTGHAAAPEHPAEQDDQRSWYREPLNDIRDAAKLPATETRPTDPVRLRTVWDAVDAMLAKIGRAIPAERKVEMPGRLATRGNALTVIFQAFGLKIDATLAPTRSEEAQIGLTARALGIVQGYADGLLHLDRLVNWAELATMVQRTLGVGR